MLSDLSINEYLHPNTLIQGPPGLAAPHGVRAPPVVLQDQGDREVQAPRPTGLRDKGPSSNSKPRHQPPGRGSRVSWQPPALSNSPQSRVKTWVWGKAKPSRGKWDQRGDQWGRPGKQVRQEPHQPRWWVQPGKMGGRNLPNQIIYIGKKFPAIRYISTNNSFLVFSRSSPSSLALPPSSCLPCMRPKIRAGLSPSSDALFIFCSASVGRFYPTLWLIQWQLIIQCSQVFLLDTREIGTPNVSLQKSSILYSETCACRKHLIMTFNMTMQVYFVDR